MNESKKTYIFLGFIQRTIIHQRKLNDYTALVHVLNYHDDLYFSTFNQVFILRNFLNVHFFMSKLSDPTLTRIHPYHSSPRRPLILSLICFHTSELLFPVAQIPETMKHFPLPIEMPSAERNVLSRTSCVFLRWESHFQHSLRYSHHLKNFIQTCI